MEFEDGFTVPWHSHENEQVTEVIEGVLRFWFDDDENNPLDLFPDWRRYAARVRSVGISVPMNNDFALAGGLSI